MERIAVYSLGLSGLYVLIVDSETVTWWWHGESRRHKAKVRYAVGGRAYFMAAGRRVPLADCLVL